MIESIKVAILAIAAITITSMAVQFDPIIVNAAIFSITGMLGVNRYLEGRTSDQGAPIR